MTVLRTFIQSCQRDTVHAIRSVIHTIRTEPVHMVTLGLVTLWAVALRAAFIHQPMRVDESFTYTRYAAPPIGSGLLSYYHPNNHVLHSILVRLSTLSLSEAAPWAIRLPAFVAGVLTVPAGYVFTRAFLNRHAAILAAGLLAASSVLIEFSTNARGYTLVCLFTVLLLTTARWVKDTSSPTAWAMHALIAALGMWTIPIMVFPIGISGVWLIGSVLLGDTRIPTRLFIRNIFISLFTAVVLTVLLYLPIIVRSGMAAIVSNKWIEPKSWGEFTSALPEHLHHLWRQWNRDIPTVLTATLAIGAITCAFLYKRVTDHKASIVLAVIAWVVPVAFARRITYVTPRIWLYLLPIYIAVATGGLCYLISIAWRYASLPTNKLVRNAAPLLAAAVSVWVGTNVLTSQSILQSRDTGTAPDTEQVVLFIDRNLQPDDKVVIVNQRIETLVYYFQLHSVPFDVIASAPTTAKRLWLVMGEQRNHNLEQATALARQRCPGIPNGLEPTPIDAFSNTRIYRFDECSSE